MKQITAGVYTFTGLVAGRVYLIEDADGLTLIDAGLGLAAKRIARQLAHAGYAVEGIERILITHAHPDHIGGLTALQTQSGAEVFCSEPERAVIEAEGGTVAMVVAEGATIGTLGGLEVIHTPGHTAGHMTFWQPDRRLMFCGDVMMNFGGLRLPPPIVTVDMTEDKRSIVKLAGYAPDLICFGHGPPMPDAAQTLNAYAAKVNPGDR